MPRLSRMEKYAELRRRLENTEMTTQPAVEEEKENNENEQLECADLSTSEIEASSVAAEENAPEEKIADFASEATKAVTDFQMADEKELASSPEAYETDKDIAESLEKEAAVEEETAIQIEDLLNSFQTLEKEDAEDVSKVLPEENPEEVPLTKEPETLNQDAATFSVPENDTASLTDESVSFVSATEETEKIPAEIEEKVVTPEVEELPSEEDSKPDVQVEDLAEEAAAETASEETASEETVSEESKNSDVVAPEAENTENVDSAEPVEEENKHDAEEDYLLKTLQEVTEYNKAKGLVTADEITPTILEEIRSEKMADVADAVEPEEKVVAEEKDVVSVEDDRPLSAEQQDINDTVTMEIESILRAIEEEKAKKAAEDETQPTAEDQSYMQEWVKASAVSDEEVEKWMGGAENADNRVDSLEIKDESTNVTAETPAVQTQEHPVLVKELEEKAEEEPTDLLNDTKTYIIEKDSPVTKEASSLEVEEEAPNKVLNIILMILVLALVAILAVTAYGLLRTMNIL